MLLDLGMAAKQIELVRAVCTRACTRVWSSVRACMRWSVCAVRRVRAVVSGVCACVREGPLVRGPP